MRVGEVLSGRFELVEKLSTSGNATVFRARDRLRNNDDVAIKTIDSIRAHELDRFKREADILPTLSHPNIARMIAHGESPAGERWMAQQWVTGPNLRQMLETTGMTLREAVAMARQVATALGAAHTAGVVHRDIKPSNIIANATTGQATQWIVIDFGVARVIGEETRLTQTGVVVGTLGYMAPEQARGDRGVDARADVWALGCVLYEAITGQPAFTADTAIALQAMVIAAEPPPVSALGPPGLPTTLSRVVERCLRKVRDERPADGNELAALLAEVEAAGLPQTAPRQANYDEAPTREVGPHQFVSVVLVAAEPGLDDTSLEAWRNLAMSIFSPYGGDPVVLRDGSVVFVAPATPRTSSIDTAAHAAIAAHEALQGHAIAIATASDRGLLGPSLEAAGTVVQQSALKALFADTTGADLPGVQIDELTAKHLGEQFAVTKAGQAQYLTGMRRAR